MWSGVARWVSLGWLAARGRVVGVLAGARCRVVVVVVAAVGLVVPAVAVAGSPPVLVWSPTTSTGAFDFGTVSAGSSLLQTFTLQNSGGSASSALNVALPGAGGSAAFSTTSDTCTATSLGPGKSCTVTVQYAPTNAGESDTATLTATSNKPSASAILTLTGESPAAYTVCKSGCPYSNLQDAINAVQAGTIPNPITVGPGDYTNANAVAPVTALLVTNTVTIEGVGDGTDPATNTILDGQGDTRIITNVGDLTLSGVEITNGYTGDGGGILNDGAMTFDGDVSITGNTSVSGGGILNDGTVNFAAGSTVSITGNTAVSPGGGILNQGGATVNFATGSNVSITDNTARSDGGGIYNNENATVNFATGSNVSITGNTAGFDGGGIYNVATVNFATGSNVSITGNTSISGNTPDNCDPPGSVPGCTN